MIDLFDGRREHSLNVKVSINAPGPLRFFIAAPGPPCKMKIYYVAAFCLLLCVLGVRAAGVGQREERRTISLEDLKTLADNTTVLFVEVREPSELAATGEIPGSINIPLGTVLTTLRDLPPEEFLQRFNREKPQLDTPIVFTCRSGPRARSAQDIAQNLGFQDVRSFDGGWLLWEEQLNQS